jgi:hypothetical protein
LPGKTASVRYALDLKSSSVLGEGFNEGKKRNRGDVKKRESKAERESSQVMFANKASEAGYMRQYRCAMRGRGL